jgi:predicted DNA-binding transcriptional regulator AlpA
LYLAEGGELMEYYGAAPATGFAIGAVLMDQEVKRTGSAAERRQGPRRGLSRMEGAIYVGVSATLFDEMVKDGRMPKPKRINGRVVWDIWALDEAFSELPDQDGHKAGGSWDVT